MKKINDLASMLTERVKIQSPIIIKDQLGGYITEWQDLHEVYANAKRIMTNNMKMIDILYAKQMKSIDYYQFIIRHLPDLNIAMRIKYDDQFFQIKQINDNSKTKLVILAEKEM